MPSQTTEFYSSTALIAGLKRVIKERERFHFLKKSNTEKLLDSFADLNKSSPDHQMAYWLLRKHRMSDFLCEFERENIIGKKELQYRFTITPFHDLPESKKKLSKEIQKMVRRKKMYLKKEMDKSEYLLNFWRAVDYKSDFQIVSLVHLFSNGLYRSIQTFEENVLEPWLRIHEASCFELKNGKKEEMKQAEPNEKSREEETECDDDTDRLEEEKVNRLFGKLLERIQLENEILVHHLDSKELIVTDMYRHITSSKNSLLLTRKLGMDFDMSWSESEDDDDLERQADSNVSDAGVKVSGPMEKTMIQEEMKQQLNVPREKEIAANEENWKSPKNTVRREVNAQKLSEAIELRKTLMQKTGRGNIEKERMLLEKSSIEKDEKPDVIVPKLSQKEKKQQKKLRQQERKKAEKEKEKKDMDMIIRAIEESRIEAEKAIEQSRWEEEKRNEKEMEDLYEEHLNSYRTKCKKMPVDVAKSLAQTFVERRIIELEEKLECYESEDENGNVAKRSEYADETNGEESELHQIRETLSTYKQLIEFVSDWDEEIWLHFCMMSSIRKTEYFDRFETFSRNLMME